MITNKYFITTRNIPTYIKYLIAKKGGQTVHEVTSTSGIFYTDMVAPLKKLLVSFEPIQSGSGTPSPDNIRPISGRTECRVNVSGKNLFDSSFCTNRTINGITTTLNVDGSVTLNGTATRATRYLNSNDTLGLKLSAGTYTVTPANLVLTGEGGNKKGTFTIDEEVTISNAYLTLEVNKTYDNENVYMQIEKSSTATTYEPYQSTTYTTALGRTVYGGTLDVVSGELTVDRAMVDLGTLSWGKASGGASNVRFYSLLLQSVIKKTPDNSTAGNIVCSDYENTNANKGYSGKVYPAITEDRDGTISLYDEAYASATTSEFKTAMSGVQLCYELAEPQTYQLTPQQINTIKGTNVVTVEGGDLVELVYLTHTL